MPVICSSDTNAKQIAISFDDGPAEHYTSSILDILHANKIEAAFFCIGNCIKGNEELLKRIHQEGHIIGNHSYSHHFWFDLYSAAKMSADLNQMDEEMIRVTGMKPRLFRPPYGVINPAVKKATLKGKYIPIGWNVRSMDTVTKDEQKLLSRVNKALKPGAVFLFHDTRESTAKILPEFIRQAKHEGYKIIRLDKLLNLQPYA